MSSGGGLEDVQLQVRSLGGGEVESMETINQVLGGQVDSPQNQATVNDDYTALDLEVMIEVSVIF